MLFGQTAAPFRPPQRRVEEGVTGADVQGDVDGLVVRDFGFPPPRPAVYGKREKPRAIGVVHRAAAAARDDHLRIDLPRIDRAELAEPVAQERRRAGGVRRCA